MSGKLLATESSSQCYGGRVIDYALEHILTPNISDIEDVIDGTSPGLFIPFQYPTHILFVTALNSNLVNSRTAVGNRSRIPGLIPRTYVGCPLLSLSGAMGFYQGISFYYGIYLIRRDVQDKEAQKSLCKNHPSPEWIKEFITKNTTQIKLVPSQQKAYRERTQTSTTRAKRFKEIDQQTQSQQIVAVPVIPALVDQVIHTEAPTLVQRSSTVALSPEQLKAFRDQSVKEVEYVKEVESIKLYF